MNNYRSFLLVCCLILAWGKESIGQTEIWTAVSIEKKVIQKTRLKGVLAYRVGEAFEDYSMFGQIRATRKLKNKIKIKLDYRFSRKENSLGTLRLKHRTSIIVSKDWKIHKFRFNYRSKFQVETKNALYNQ